MKNETKRKIVEWTKRILKYDEPLPKINETTSKMQLVRFQKTFIREDLINAHDHACHIIAKQLIDSGAVQLWTKEKNKTETFVDAKLFFVIPKK